MNKRQAHLVTIGHATVDTIGHIVTAYHTIGHGSVIHSTISQAFICHAIAA